MSFSESEQRMLAICPHITGSLSLLGSLSILYDIWEDRDYKIKQPYFRILLGMSICDVIVSLSLALSTLPIPEGTWGVHGARGTTRTCTAQGFFNQFMLGSILYNLVLAIFYTLSGTYRMTDEVFGRKYEPFLHGFAVFTTIGVAIAGLPLTLYNPAQICCWIAPYPYGCETFHGQHDPEMLCERGYDSWIYRWIFFYGPLWTAIIIVTALMIMLTLSVMKEERHVIVLRNRSIEARTSFVEEQDEPGNEHDISCTNNNDNNYQRPQVPKSESIRLERTKQMFYQALLYVGVFYTTWIFPTIFTFQQLLLRNVPFAIVLLTTILMPMQGFWNWLVYRHGPCVA